MYARDPRRVKKIGAFLRENKFSLLAQNFPAEVSFPSTPDGAPSPALGERSGAPSGLRPSSFVMSDTPVEVQFTSAGCLNYPCRTPCEGPDISAIAALIGNPASAHMLMALMAGPALTASELAQEAGLSLPTASGHLAKLAQAGLVAVARQGRHRYFRLADADVALALEGLMPLAARAGHLRTRTGPRDPELRRARSCYDHLAGDLAVNMFDSFGQRRFLGQHG